MRARFVWIAACAALFAARSAMATSFVVPTDEEMVAKSKAIVIGVVEGSYVQELEKNTIETVYEIRVERAPKGVMRPDELIRVVTEGGVIGDRGVYVPAAARFRQGERVLVFLTSARGQWHTTDLTLGKFKFVTSTAGERMVVRDMEDVLGWDRAGRPHHEKLRKEEGFLRFIDERVRGNRFATQSAAPDNAAPEDYFVEASAVTLKPGTEQNFAIAPNAPFSGATYTDWVNNQPIRWPNISAGITYYKRVDQNIPGAADGGVSVIQGGLAAWTNECGSNINLIYGGTTPTISQNFDTTHVVEFNDPQQRIAGSWTGSGTIGIAFMSFSSTHTFAGQTWWSISDGDVVFQDGYPATHGAFATAMTHELGHTIGWRHSNQDYATDGACNPATQECTSAAIMNSSVSAAYGFTLQPWDVNAAQSVYPGGTCGSTCTPPSITAQPQSATISGGSRTLSVTATGTTPFSYQWYTGTSGNTAAPISGATGSSITVSPNSTTSYWVRVTNSCGSANSATATITVTSTPPPPPPPPSTSSSDEDFNGDGREDVFWFNASTGQTSTWLMNGTASIPAVSSPSVPVGWTPVATGEFNGDGKDDLFWRNASTGETSVWLMNGGTYETAYRTITVPSPWQVGGTTDVDANGRADIVWYNPSTGQTSIWLFTGAGTVNPATSPSAPAGWHVRATGDFNGDGRGDLFWHNPSTGETMVWLMNGASISSQFRMVTPPTSWAPGGSNVDFDGDHRSDIFWFNSSTGQTSIWLMNGTPSASFLTSPTAPAGFRPANFGDYNGDGKGDVFWHKPSTGETRVWLMNGASILSQFSTYTTPTTWRPAP